MYAMRSCSFSSVTRGCQTRSFRKLEWDGTDPAQFLFPGVCGVEHVPAVALTRDKTEDDRLVGLWASYHSVSKEDGRRGDGNSKEQTLRACVSLRVQH